MSNVGVIQPNDTTSIGQKWTKNKHTLPLLEIVNLIGLAIVADLILFDGTAFAKLIPNPMWLLVLVMVWRHGTGYGIMAAALCAIYFLYARGMVTEELNWLLVTPNYMMEPILWFVAAVIVGELRRRERQHYIVLEECLNEKRREHDATATELDSINKKCDALQAQLQAQIDVAQYALSMIRQLDKLTPDTITDWIVDIVVNVLDPGKFSVYLANPEGLHKQLVWGGDHDDALPSFYGNDTALYQKVVKEGRVLCIADDNEVAMVENYGVLAGPLWTSGQGKVIGVIKFESMPFSRLNPQTVARLGIIGEWIGVAVSEMHSRSSAKKSRLASITKTSVEGVDPSLSEIYAMQQRLGFDVSTIVFEPNTVKEGDDAAMYETVIHALDKAVSEVRSTDYLMTREGNRGRYTFVLPKTTPAQAQVITNRVRSVVAQHLPESLQNVPISATVEPWPTIIGQNNRHSHVVGQ